MNKHDRLTQELHNLSDKEYLNKYIESISFLHSNEIWIIKDYDSACTAASLMQAKMVGFNKISDFIGIKDENTPCRTAEIAETFYNQDREVETTRKKLYMLDIHEYHTGLTFLKTIKKPIINPGTGNVLGTFGHCAPFIPSSNLKTILDIHKIRFGNHPSMKVTNDPSNFKLTEIEQAVLFCICLGINSRKDIACLLSAIYKREVSASNTVNDTIRRLYQKLDCNSPSQLLAVAEYSNLNLEIPKNFLPTGSYIIG